MARNNRAPGGVFPGVTSVPLPVIGIGTRGLLTVLLTALSAPAMYGDGCGKTPPLHRVIVNASVEGETTVSAIYRFAHGNGICVGLVLNDPAWFRPVPKSHFENSSVETILRRLVPGCYRISAQSRVVMIEPVTGAPAWLSERIPHFRLRRPEEVRMVVEAKLYMEYEMARNPKRTTGFAGSILGSDPSNRVGPLDERNRTVLELLNIIAERSRGAMWVGLPERWRGAMWDHVDSPKWHFIEYQWPEDSGLSTLRWIKDQFR